MLTPKEHAAIFFEFIKSHSSFEDMPFGTPPQNQQIVRLIVDKDETTSEEDIPVYRKIKKSIVPGEGFVIVDPQYDNIYKSFLGLTYNLDSVEFIKQLGESISTPEEVAALWLELFINPLSESVNAGTLYVVTIGDNTGWNSDIWDETVKISGTVEDFLGL